MKILGLASGLVPMYLTEVSPINLRGMIGSIHQLLVTISILVSQVAQWVAALARERERVGSSPEQGEETFCAGARPASAAEHGVAMAAHLW